MTWTRQQRHKARAGAVVLPYRQDGITQAIVDFYESGENCLVGMKLGVRTGRIINYRIGGFVQVGTDKLVTNIPWRMVTRVEAWR